jgi:hypothetical protein
VDFDGGENKVIRKFIGCHGIPYVKRKTKVGWDSKPISRDGVLSRMNKVCSAVA